MVFDYTVKHDGIYYAPGENVPLEKVENNNQAEPKIEPEKPIKETKTRKTK